MVSGEENSVKFPLWKGPLPYILYGQFPVSIIDEELSDFRTHKLQKHYLCKRVNAVRLGAVFTLDQLDQSN